ncbi:MAG: sialate O-acetylesterase [Planctomycetota bacterium]
MSDNAFGAVIEAGPADWQIFQQNSAGVATIAAAGRWVVDAEGEVEVRLVREDTATPVTAALDWQKAAMLPGNKWQASLANVPAGGLYRFETRFRAKGTLAGEWSNRGDMRHFLGVGDLWVIAGQSNSAGYGRGPVADSPELGLHMFRHSETWALASHPMNEATDTKHPANREGGNAGHSPYLHFARLLKNELGHPIGLIPTALGGSPLSAWNPAQSSPAVLFDTMVHTAALCGGKVKGILWYQGESDANSTDAPTYLARFTDAVAAWRTALGDPALPVLTVQLNRVYCCNSEPVNRDWTILRGAQRRAARDIPATAVVSILDAPLSDGIHISPAGNMAIGERLARAALGMVHGKAIDWQCPDLASAKASADGKEIVLTFAPVTSRLDSIAQTDNPFLIEDADGAVGIEKFIYPGDATIRLALNRPLSGKALIHGAYGTNPAIVPMDMERFVPILGFYGVTVHPTE